GGEGIHDARSRGSNSGKGRSLEAVARASQNGATPLPCSYGLESFMRLLLLSLAAVLIPAVTLAQSKDPFKGAVIDAAQADEDFGVQGEYVGELTPPGQPWMQVGLQVVALGGGKFDGVLYRGGLPGAGWDGS